VHHDASKYNGYRLTSMGYDFLAIRTLLKRGVIASVGRQIGVGKESDVFEVTRHNGPHSLIRWLCSRQCCVGAAYAQTKAVQCFLSQISAHMINGRVYGSHDVFISSIDRMLLTGLTLVNPEHAKTSHAADQRKRARSMLGMPSLPWPLHQTPNNTCR